MGRTVIIRALAGIGAALSGLPAEAFALTDNGYRAGLTLRGGYERVTVDYREKDRSNSSFTQQLLADFSGPLGSPMLGSGSATMEFSEGDETSRVVTGGNPNHRKLAYSFRGSLFPEDYRRYVVVQPLARRAENRMEWAGMPGREYADSTLGGTAGVTLPGLPRYHVTYHDTERRDGVAGSGFNQDIRSVRHRSSYNYGPLRWEYDRQVRESEPVFDGGRESHADTTVSTADLTFNDIEGTAVESVFVRLSYRGSQVANGMGEINQRTFAENAYVTSEPYRLRGVSSFVRYGQSLATESIDKKTRFGNDLALFSRYIDRRWNVENRLQYANTFGESNRVGDRLNVGSAWRDQSVRHSIQAEETYLWGDQYAEAHFRDSVTQRLSVFPRRSYDVFVLQRYAATRAPGQPTDSTRFSYGGGGNVRPVRHVTAGVTYERRHARFLRTAPRVISDRIAFTARSRPLEELGMELSYILELDDYEAAWRDPDRTGTLNASVSYAPLTGLSLKAKLNYIGREIRNIEASPLDVALISDYHVGKTVFSASWESREIAAVNPYRRLAASVTRRL